MEYVHKIFIDNIYAYNGFDSITGRRIYAEQFEQIDWQPSVYEIITGHSCDHNGMGIDKLVSMALGHGDVWRFS